MPRCLAAAAAAAVLCSLPAQTPSPATVQPVPEPPHHLVEVVTSGPRQMQRLLALDLDIASCQPPLPAQRRIEIIATDADLLTLKQAGFQARVVQRNLEAYYAAEAAAVARPTVETLTPPIGQGSMGGHYTLAEMEAFLDQFHAQYPTICSAKVSIGTSIEGRSIWMVKISDNVNTDENEPEVLFDALHHAREPLSMETTLLFMSQLLDGYGSDPEATFLVNERELFFVPCVNPDGYEYNRTNSPGGGGMWRKNRRNNGNGTFGVDLNRNYLTGWTAPNGGNSTSTNSDVYRGTAPFSEPETAALEAFAASRQFVTVFSTHTYTDILLRPWGYQVGEAANSADYIALSQYMVLENGMPHGPVSTSLYIAAGTAVDHHHVVRGAYSLSAELGRSNEGGFWPSGQFILDIAYRNQRMFRKVALTAGAAFEIASVTVAEAPGGNGNNQVDAGESGQVTVACRNLGVQPASASLQLQAVTAGISTGPAVGLGVLAKLSTASNAVPLTFTVPAGFSGAAVVLRVLLTGDGRSSEQLVVLPFRSERPVVDDDFERDRGFQRGSGDTAVTGRWERAVPQPTLDGSTTAQIGTQTTPGGSRCWVTDGRAGTAATTYDVDGGYTDLLSPVLDLGHLYACTASFDLWYYESARDDAMSVGVSRDGGATWTNVYSRSAPTGAWTRIDVDLGAPLTNQMRLRVRAQDLADSIVECQVDGLQLHGYALDGAVTLLGSGALGSVVRAGMNAPPGAYSVLLTSPVLGTGTTFPGVGGSLLLDPNLTFVLPWRTADGTGYAAMDIDIPANPALTGARFWFQQAVVAGTIAFGGNAPSVLLQ